MIRGSAVLVSRPNVVLLLMLVIGLLNSAWLKILKNSARNSIFSRSPTSGVVFAKARSKFARPGPRRKFRGKEPYVASDGSATICASEGNSPGPGVHGSG